MVSSEPRKRVVITGMGAICPGANTTDEFWQGLCQGRSDIRVIDQFDVSDIRVKIAGICRGFDPGAYFSERDQSKLSRLSQFGIAATDQAKRAAGLGGGPFDNGVAGVLMGTGFGGQQVIEDYYEGAFCNRPEKKNPLAIPLAMANACSSNIAIHFKARGPNLTVATACSSGANAIGTAFALVRSGTVQTMIAGGVEAAVTPMVMRAWSGMRVLSRQNDNPQRACKPFSKNRDGFVLTEGCGVVVMEELTSALQRGATILGEIIGYASGADATHVTRPAIEGQTQAMRACLADAGILPDQVDCINAHGTGTRPNDSAESAGIREVFGKRADRIPVSGIKSMIGHAMGAAGALECIATALALSEGIAPPTINYEQFDPECDLDYVTEGARPGTYRIALSNSFGFGGNNAVLALKRWQE